MRYGISIALLFSFGALFSLSFTGDPCAAGTGPVRGFADIHLHQMAEYAFAGAWFHGSHSGPESVALGKCSGGGILGDLLGGRGGRREGAVEAMAKSAARSIGSQVGRAIIRGVLGSIFGGRR